MPELGFRKRRYEYEKIMRDWGPDQYTEVINGIPVSCGKAPMNPINKTDCIDDELFFDLDADKQFLCENWVVYGLDKTKKSVLNITSYGLKHILQSDTGVYLTNNQFKHLMLLQGFNPVDEKELNWRFHISKRSPALKKKKVK